MNRFLRLTMALIILVACFPHPLAHPTVHASSPFPAATVRPIDVNEDGFSPSTITIDVGDSVKWANRTSTSCRVKVGAEAPKTSVYLPVVLRAGGSSALATPSYLSAGTQAMTWESPELTPGAEWVHTFDSAGRFPYYDPLHPERTGLVVVLGTVAFGNVTEADGGTIVTDQCVIEFPPGAVTETLTVTYTAQPLPWMPTDYIRPTLAFQLTAVNPWGEPRTQFLLPFAITCHYEDEEVSDLDEATLDMYWQDGVQGGWVPLLGTLDVVQNQLVATSTHLSTFAVVGKVLPPPGAQDSDGDGLYDAEEAAIGTDPNNPDSDQDGLSDYTEVRMTGTDPNDADSDDDGLSDYDEVALSGTDPNDSDSDDDGLHDAEEAAIGTDPNNSDSDQDGLSDYDEVRVTGTDPNDADSDDDGLDDGPEVNQTATNPLDPDCDKDGLLDGLEIALGTDPEDADTDGDGLADEEEIILGIDGFLTDPLAADTDGDGLDDLQDQNAGCSPVNPDSDNDGLSDGEEVLVHTTDPLDTDSDDDGLTDLEEIGTGNDGYVTDPNRSDTDGDGMPDLWEINNELDPTVPDAATDPDGDGLLNGDEYSLGTNPQLADTDQDGLNDGDEVSAITDPLDPDSDDDGLVDAVEVAAGTDPRDDDSDGDGMLDGTEAAWGSDTDGDGLINALDTDSDGDGLGDAVEDANRDGRIEGDTNLNRMLDVGETWTETDPTSADTDRDSLPDGWEVTEAFDPLDPMDAIQDPDMDGLTNRQEYLRDTAYNDADSDGDGLPDGVEVAYGLDPLDASDAALDADGDLMDNLTEYGWGVAAGNHDPDGDGLDNVLDADADGDGLDDGTEDANRDGLIEGDANRNRMLDTGELWTESDPLNPDTDGDGVRDGTEPQWNADADADGRMNAVDADSDGDGLSDGVEDANQDGLIGGDTNGNRWLDEGESWSESDPLSADSDRDGLSDGEETNGTHGYVTDRRRADTDGDGLDDRAEIGRFGTSPIDPDSDDDQVGDGQEVWLELDPLDPDSDWDGVIDGLELREGTDPLRPDSDGDGLWDDADPWPLERDHDRDGLWDGQELTPGANGLRYHVEDYSPDSIEEKAVFEEFVNPAIIDSLEMVTGGVAVETEIAVIPLEIKMPPPQRLAEFWTYDRLQVGTEPSEWQGDPLVITDVESHSRSHALEFSDLDDGVQVRSLYLFRPTTGHLRLDFWVNAEDITDGAVRLSVQQSALDKAGMALIFYNGGDVYYEAASGRTPCASSLSGWHRFRLETHDVQGGTFTIWVDGQKIAEGVNLAGSPASLAAIVVADDDDSGRGTGRLYLDDMAFQAQTLPETGEFRLFARARGLNEQANGERLSLTLADGTGSVLEQQVHVMFDLYRWYTTAAVQFAPNSEYALRLVDPTGAKGVAVDQVLVVWGDPAPLYHATLADVSDSDGDGLQDGFEAAPTDFWFEAELYGKNPVVDLVAGVLDDDCGLEAANSLASVNVEGDKELVQIPAGPTYPAGTYQVYVRARMDPALIVDPTLIVHAQSEGEGFTQVVTLTDRYEWLTSESFALVLEHPGAITIDVSATDNPSDSVWVDRVLLTQRLFIPGDHSKVWVWHPRNLTDPLDPDTDGDGWRAEDLSLPGSMGYLTDGWEREIHTNPTDIDTDGDADMDPSRPDLVDPALTDDADNNPLSDDNDADGLRSWLDPDDDDDDVDDDGILDGNEDLNLNGAWDPGAETDLLNIDTDGDRLLDGTERGLVEPEGNDTNPGVFVADADPITRSDPLRTDSDGDGLDDGLEDLDANGRHDLTTEPTDATQPDTDRDLLNDGTEDANADGAIEGDTNGNRLIDNGEIWSETDPATADTDGDGLGDGLEVLSCGTSPVSADTDGDDLDDRQEVLAYATDPNDADSDGDSLLDGREVYTHYTMPLNVDSDGDGLEDGDEILTQLTDPLNPDSDGDGLSDWEEVNVGNDGYITDPLDPDMDGDGVTDGLEAQYGWDPTDTTTPSAPAASQVFEMATVQVSSNTNWSNEPSAPGVLVTSGIIELGDANAFSVSLHGTLTVTLSTGDMVGTGEIWVEIAGEDQILPVNGQITFDTSSALLSGTVYTDLWLPAVPPVNVEISGNMVIDLDNGSINTNGVVEINLIRAEGDLFIWPSQRIVSLGSQAEPITFHLMLPDPIDVDVTFGTAYATLNLSDTLSLAGGAALTIPDLPGGATLELPSAEFLVDLDTWHFIFDVATDFTLELGSVELSVGGPVGARFELAIESGFLGIEGSFDFDPIEIEGTLEIDLFSTIEPNIWYTPTHTTSQIAGFKGHYRVEASVPIPLPPPPLPPGPAALNITGETVVRLPFLDPDLDPLEPPSFGNNGTCDLEAGLGIASLGIEIGGVSSAIDFTNKKIYFASESGIALGDLVEGLPAGLGNIGIGPQTQAEFILDWEPDPSEYVAYTAAISDVYTMPISPTYPILVGSGMYNYYGFQIDIRFLIDFDLEEVSAGDHVGGLYMGGELNLPIDVGTPVAVTGSISWDGDLYLSGTSELEIAGYQLAGAHVTLTNDSLTIDGALDIPGVGSAAIEGQVTADGTYAFTGTATLQPGGFDLANGQVRFNNDGLWVNGQVTLPADVATVTISGTVTPFHYHFEGTADLTFGGFEMASAQVVLDKSTGLQASGTIQVPHAGSLSLTGYLQPNGAYALTGSGLLAPYDIQLLNASFALSRPVGGPTTFTGNGAVSAGSKTLASATFTIQSNGYISGSGTLGWSAASVDASFTIDPAGDGGQGGFALEGTFTIDATINGYGVLGTATFSASGSAGSVSIGATFAGSIECAGLTLTSVQVSVNSNGTIQVGGFPYWCPTLTDWDRICHKPVTIDIL